MRLFRASIAALALTFFPSSLNATAQLSRHADADPANDEIVGPPDVIDDCADRLDKAHVEFAVSKLPLRRDRAGFTCGSEQVVVYRKGPTGVRWSSAPVVTCGMALALADFENVVADEARVLGHRVVRIEHGGTYSCRKMSRFSIVSEHSYANAIDVRSFTLDDGRRISVLRHFGMVDREPTTIEGRFLRSLARRLYDDGTFSVVLTRYFDELHRDHFHFDLARYRIDGTR